MTSARRDVSTSTLTMVRLEGEAVEVGATLTSKLTAVGGEMLDLVLAQIKPYARIVMCGAISQYK